MLLSTSSSSLALPKSPLKNPYSTSPRSEPMRRFPTALICKIKPQAPPAGELTTTFGFSNLKQTCLMNVERAESRPLNVPLLSSFTTASSRLDTVENVGVRIELSDGCSGLGEAPVLLPLVDQLTALAKAQEACALLKASPRTTLGDLLQQIGALLPGHEFASVRAAVEMALIDAAASSRSIPLWSLFGGDSNSIITDITIPIVSPAEAASLALEYCEKGFTTLKLKVGKDLKTDIEVLHAIHAVHPHFSYILDANEGYKPQEAIHFLERLHEMGVTPILLEQPVQRDDWDGLGRVGRFAREKFGVSVAADESCRSLADVQRIAEGDVVDVINIKLAKLGVIGALDIIEAARSARLDLMIGGMVETRLAMGFAGHLAAGLGIFKFIDLATPLLLSEDPVQLGYEVHGSVYKFTNVRGSGAFLHWNNVAC